MLELVTTWVLTGSPENYGATRAHEFSVIGLKERNRARAEKIEPGDRIVLYITRVKAFAAAITVTGELYEGREQIWPGRAPSSSPQAGSAVGGKVDPYPWRFPTAPEVVVEEHDWVEAEELVDELEHVAKWPREHWTLAFQGQIRTVSDHDAGVLVERLRAAAPVPS